MKNYFYFIGLMLLFISCKDSAPGPSTTTPGKRDYTWTRDTLFYLGNAQTTMQSMYASSAKNVYVVGHCEVSRGRMWRYDGSLWNVVDVSSVRGGLEAIDGTEANDIWVAGGQGFFSPDSSYIIDSTLIAHFDGTAWRQVNVQPRRGGLWCIDVVSPTVLFAGGEKGLLCKRNGNDWTVYEMGNQYFFSSIAAVGVNEAYAIGHVNDDIPPIDSSGSFLFRFNGLGWEKIDSVMRTPNAPPQHMGIGVYAYGSTLYSLGSNVYRQSGSGWIKLADGEVGHMRQSGTNNIVAVGQPILHFNGIDWKEFAEFRANPVPWSDCFTDASDIFFVGNDNWKTFVVHGK